MPKRLLIAAAADRVIVERAKADPRFEVIDQPVRTEEELAAIVGDCEILVTRSYNRVTRRVLDAAPRLELIAQGTSGTDNIDAVNPLYEGGIGRGRLDLLSYAGGGTIHGGGDDPPPIEP